MKKFVALLLAAVILLGAFSACTGEKESYDYTVGICNYVDDASLNQIAQSLKSRLLELSSENGVKIKVLYDNCNGDSSLLSQIIANFTADGVDLMVGIATPVAVAMQAATEESKIPVVFAAVSDPVGVELVSSLSAPGANVTGTSDYLDTNAVMELIFALKPETGKIGLLYDIGQDSSTAPIAAAKEYLKAKNVEFVERTGTTVDEISLAVDALIKDGVDAVFTPTDNTVMKSELAIYEKLEAAKIPHFTGADSFALNGAFLGYGVDYENLGKETAEMVKEILIDKKDPATLAVRTFDNGTATINTEVCESLGYSFDEVSKTISPLCTAVKGITLAEDFEEVTKG